MGRKQINEPGEALSARFPKGTLRRIEAVLAEGEPKAAFIRNAIESELVRREGVKPAKPKAKKR